ncbi:hypothetical protein OEZ86_007134 [Tetradesmus obliquus]|nr:hypothetical protein OEZ86_007134 [Tetradesmus obliquus]
MDSEADLTAKAKFGGLKPKARLIVKDKKCFDSADWALAKEGKKQAQIECLATAMAVPDVHHNAKHTGSHLKPSG